LLDTLEQETDLKLLIAMLHLCVEFVLLAHSIVALPFEVRRERLTNLIDFHGLFAAHSSGGTASIGAVRVRLLRSVKLQVLLWEWPRNLQDLPPGG